MRTKVLIVAVGSLILAMSSRCQSDGQTGQSATQANQPVGQNQDQNQDKKIEKNYVISPSHAVRGETYDFTLQDLPCQTVQPSDQTLDKATVVAPQGFGVTITPDATNRKPCSISGKLTIDKTALLEVINLRVLDEKSQKLFGLAPLQVIAVQPGPTPPGLPAQVDLLWNVLPRDIVHANFGHEIANNFYCVEVVIGNNSGYDLQLATIGFESKSIVIDPRSQTSAKLPAASSPIVRGTLERGSETGLRNYTLRIAQALGPFAAGFIPFFHVPAHQANYSDGVALFNLLKSGYELAVPDLTISQTNRLENQILHDNLVISNNRQVRTMIFIPKKLLKVVGDADDSVAVMSALGQLILTGNTVQYLARVSVVATPGTDKTPKVTNVTYPGGAQVKSFAFTSGQSNQDVSITLTGENLEEANIIVPPDTIGLAIPENTTVRSAGQLTVTVRVLKDTKAGSYKLQVKNPYGTSDFTFVVTDKKP